MGRYGMGEASGVITAGGKVSNDVSGINSNRGPRNPNGTWMGGVERGPYKPFPFSVGATFGKLTVLRYEQHTRATGRSAGWQPIVKCACGWEGKVDRGNLKSGRTTQCNSCAKIAAGSKRYWCYKAALPDDEHRTRLLNRLAAAITRCHSPSSRVFQHYGGRGICVHKGWRDDRASFLRYIQTIPDWDNPKFEMARIDVDRGYEPGNIRFVSRSDNLKNKRQVSTMQERIAELEAEVAYLRSFKCRTA